MEKEKINNQIVLKSKMVGINNINTNINNFKNNSKVKTYIANRINMKLITLIKI